MFTVYPNPATDKIVIQLNGVNNNDYLIYSPEGKVVSDGNIQNEAAEINICSLAAGFYFITVEIDGETFYQKFVIE
jgi:histidine ammonia-lyase